MSRVSIGSILLFANACAPASSPTFSGSSERGRAAPPDFDVSGDADLALLPDAAPGYFGYSLAPAGDLNGDGLDDIVVGAMSYSANRGAIHVFYGEVGGPSTTADLAVEGMAPSTGFGNAVSGAGDVNGDGYDDVVVGAASTDGTAGAAYVFHGSAAGLDDTPAAELEGTSSSNFGASVAGAGDVDGDGYDDVVVGAPWASSFSGYFTVYYGSDSGIGDRSTTVAGTSTSMLGSLVIGGGDVNGDGYDDIVVSLSGGTARLYPGSHDGITESSFVTLSWSSSTGTAGLGYAMSPAGDVNADGYDDVVFGYYLYSGYTGLGLVALGSSTGLPSTDMVPLDSPDAMTMFGQAVAGVGDMDGDGYDDVAGSGPWWDSGDEHGLIEVFLGGDRMDISGDGTVYGDTRDVGYGYALAGAGDINGDGYDDMMAGQYGRDRYMGSVWVYYGSPSDEGEPAETGETGGTPETGGPETGGTPETGSPETGAPESGASETGDPDSEPAESGSPGGEETGSGLDGDGGDKAGGCACSSGGRPGPTGSAALLGLLALMGLRRRQN